MKAWERHFHSWFWVRWSYWPKHHQNSFALSEVIHLQGNFNTEIIWKSLHFWGPISNAIKVIIYCCDTLFSYDKGKQRLGIITTLWYAVQLCKAFFWNINRNCSILFPTHIHHITDQRSVLYRPLDSSPPLLKEAQINSLQLNMLS